MRTVVPAFIKISNRTFNPSWDCIDFVPYLIMLLSTICFHKFELVIMPEFTPTDWMLTMHRKKSDQDWEVYAECIREAMAKYSGMPMRDDPMRHKVHYEDFMCGDRIEL